MKARCRPPDEEDRFAEKPPEPPEPLVKILTRRPVTAGEVCLPGLTTYLTEQTLSKLPDQQCWNLAEAVSLG